MESPTSCVSTTSSSGKKLAALSNPLSMTLILLTSHFLVILLFIYSATKKVLTIPHDATLGTIVRTALSICKYYT